MKRKRLDPALRAKARKVASVIGAVHALLVSIEKNFAESDVDDDENFELMALGTFANGDGDDDSEASDEDATAVATLKRSAARSLIGQASNQQQTSIKNLVVQFDAAGTAGTLNFNVVDGKVAATAVGDEDRYVEHIGNDEGNSDDSHLNLDAAQSASTSQHQPVEQANAHEILLLFSLDDFRKQFGVQQRTFEVIGQLVAPYTLKASSKVPGRAQIPAEKQLLISLWLLVNQESFKDVGARFAVCRKTAWQCLHRVVRALVKINQERSVIQWPSLERAREIIDGFHELSGFPSVMGVIDSVQIPIKAPPVAPDVYANPKGFHSVILQAVCDSKMQFIDCYIGEGGSTEDAVVLSRSPLQQIMSTPPLFPSNCHLVGECVYPLQTHLLTAYDRDDAEEDDDDDELEAVANRNLTDRQRRYNECVLKCLNVIQQTFAAVKGRFRRLRRLEMSRVDKIPETIMACCVLHNICVQLDDAPDAADLMNARRDERPTTTVLSDEREEAIIKREDIATTLYFEYKR